MHMQRATSGAAGNGLYTTIKYMSGAAGIGLDTTIKYPWCTTTQRPEHCATHNERRSGNGLGTSIKYLRRTTNGAARNGLSRSQ